MQIRQDDPAADHVAPLLALHLTELRAGMEGFSFALDSSGLAAPGVTFWTAWAEDGTIAGMAAMKQLSPDHGELKSMRATPAMRGRGVGRALLTHIVATAHARGYRRLSLETGTAALHDDAVRLYRASGFVPCGPFADYAESPHNQFFTLDLGDA